MENTTKQHSKALKNSKNLLIGVLVGGLVGAAAMLLFAPQAGRRTRDVIQQKSIELRDQTTSNIKKAFAKIRSKTDSITTNVREKAEELKQLSQDKIVEKLDRVSAAVEAA